MASFANPAATWNQRFGQSGYWFGLDPNEWLREHADVWQPGERVLCVADGEGRNSVWLAERGLAVDAFDISEVGMQKARELAGERGVDVDFAVADIAQLVWPEAVYDGVAAIFFQFADPELRATIFSGLARCLKPGGMLVLQGYGLKQLDYRTGGPGMASHLYTVDLLRAAFADLEIVDLREYEAELAEGTGHKGRSSLIGLVARKR